MGVGVGVWVGWGSSDSHEPLWIRRCKTKLVGSNIIIFKTLNSYSILSGQEWSIHPNECVCFQSIASFVQLHWRSAYARMELILKSIVTQKRNPNICFAYLKNAPR